MIGGILATALLLGASSAEKPAASRQARSVEEAPWSTGCLSRSQRYPWGRKALRTWSPIAAREAMPMAIVPGSAYGPPFVARLVHAFGDDYGAFRRIVVLETPAGCRRQFTANSLAAADRRAIAAEMARHPTRRDTHRYRVAYVDRIATPGLVSSGRLGLYESPHFAIWYGKDRRGDFYRTIAAGRRSFARVLTDTAAALERSWYLSRDVLRAPMPFAADRDRRKLNVFLCGTGRPETGGDLSRCVPNAAGNMALPGDLVLGDPTYSHELTHMIQFHTGGFRMPQYVPTWETNAEWAAIASGGIGLRRPLSSASAAWNAVFASAATPLNTAGYINNLRRGPFAPSAPYQAHPIMAYLFETDATRDLVFRAWTDNLRDTTGRSKEEFAETVVRLGRASGAYPDGWRSFADAMGWYGARLVAMDFLGQRGLLDAIRLMPSAGASRFTPLVPVADAGSQGVYAVPPNRALLPWGTHLIPLTPVAHRVCVSLTGGTAANDAAWRFVLVAVGAGDDPTYSSLGSVVGTGSDSIALEVGAASKLYLAVTATPYTYRSIDRGKNDGTGGKPDERLPYIVKIDGATPQAVP